jgi:hypothetical protein
VGEKFDADRRRRDKCTGMGMRSAARIYQTAIDDLTRNSGLAA